MDFTKLDGLIPAVVQDDATNEVLMVGFMNAEALAKTRDTGYVTFFSRSRNTLWTKGETSGNRLAGGRLLVDCDDDTLLVRARTLGDGNVCHTGSARASSGRWNRVGLQTGSRPKQETRRSGGVSFKKTSPESPDLL